MESGCPKLRTPCSTYSDSARPLAAERVVAQILRVGGAGADVHHSSGGAQGS